MENSKNKDVFKEANEITAKYEKERESQKEEEELEGKNSGRKEDNRGHAVH